MLELYLDVSELGPELFIGSLQGGQGVRLLPSSSAAGTLLGHGEAARQGGESRPEALVPALARGFSSLPPSHYIFLLAWKEGNHITTVRVLEVGRRCDTHQAHSETQDISRKHEVRISQLKWLFHGLSKGWTELSCNSITPV